MGAFSKFNPFTFGTKSKVCQNALLAAHTFSLMSEYERDLIRSKVYEIYENTNRKKITYEELIQRISTVGLYYFYSLAMGNLGISPAIRNEMWFHVDHPFRESNRAEDIFPSIKINFQNKYFTYFPDLMDGDPFPPYAKINQTEQLSNHINNPSLSVTKKQSSITAEAQQMVDHFKKLHTKVNLVNEVNCPSCNKIGFTFGIKCSQCGFLAEDEYDLLNKLEKNTANNSLNSSETIKDIPQNQKTNSIKPIPTSTSVISASFSEYFDLIDSSGRLIADIGVMLTDDFSMLFKTGDAVPTSRKTTFSTSEDNQDSAEITLAARLENGKVFNIGNYVCSGISHAPKGIPVITVTISIKHRELEISAVDSFGSSNIKIAKM